MKNNHNCWVFVSAFFLYSWYSYDQNDRKQLQPYRSVNNLSSYTLQEIHMLETYTFNIALYSHSGLTFI